MATCQISSIVNASIAAGGLGLLVLGLIRLAKITITGRGERTELQSAG